MGVKNSCKVAAFSQDKWGGLSPWKHSSHGCLSEDRDVYDGVMAKKDILNSKGLYKQLLLLYITAAHTQQIRNPSEHQ